MNFVMNLFSDALTQWRVESCVSLWATGHITVGAGCWMGVVLPRAEAHWAPPGCSPHRTSCPGICARSSRGFSVGSRPEVCGRTCTAPLVCTKGQKREAWGTVSIGGNSFTASCFHLRWNTDTILKHRGDFSFPTHCCFQSVLSQAANQLSVRMNLCSHWDVHRDAVGSTCSYGKETVMKLLRKHESSWGFQCLLRSKMLLLYILTTASVCRVIICHFSLWNNSSMIC